MGLNEDELSAREHQHMREVLLSGAHRIKPVGSRRTLIAGALAILLVCGVAAGAVTAASLVGAKESAPAASPTSTPSPTPMPTSSPTPTPSPVLPTVAFGGDCGALLSDAEASDLLAEPATRSASDAHLLTDKAASAALLGGLTCGWFSESQRFLSVTVLDAASVTPQVAAAYGEMNCGRAGVYCEQGAVREGAWVGVGLPTVAAPERDMTDQERADLEYELRGVLEYVAAKTTEGVAVAAPRAAAWWMMPDCAVLEPVVESALGVELDVGFPGDSTPSGMYWDILVGAEMDEWCHWYRQEGTSVTIVEIHPQPGAGQPSSAAIANPDVTGTDVPGAQAAWIEIDPASATAYLAALTGTNRLTIRLTADDPAREIATLASAILAVID